MAKVHLRRGDFGLWRGQPDLILSEIWVQGKPLEVVQGSMTRNADLSLHCDGVEFQLFILLGRPGSRSQRQNTLNGIVDETECHLQAQH